MSKDETSEEDTHPDPKRCPCRERTVVDGEHHKYWPKDFWGRPTGHHPSCKHYERPPTSINGRD